MQTPTHTFHMVNQSPWPITSAASAMLITSGMIKWFHFNSYFMFLLGIILMLLTMLLWWRDVVREGTYQGLHTELVTKGLQWGMILFIISEILFFMSFFWAFFHSSLSPCVELGASWPPKGISPFNPFQVPLLNTAILLASGVTVTWAHQNILSNLNKKAFQSLLLTCLLGIYFTILQIWEYYQAPFSISDSIYGSTFFVATGFHGLHVIIGSSFLTICLMRIKLSHLSSTHHFGFEAAAWYWHFVDVVWLFLFTFIY
uniref:Cytochrome c oxidase subunit 3 n=1 Tax=Songthela hangzhouensis TaxID=1649374 RepID=Q6JT40_9ARAC|nr:cytochrome c oxidase subunit III [Songthela hangzhouensis]AAP51138.1 cytochrome c oxidase subunit III [Songthela hangzhouensis]